MTITEQSHLRRARVAWTALLLAAASCTATAIADAPVAAAPAPSCLADGTGFFRARLSGSVAKELVWQRGQLACSGSVRPGGGGIRLTFSPSDKRLPDPWVVIFGIGGVREGQAGTALPANITLTRGARGEFFSTQGDGRCTVDELRQTALTPAPLRTRTWRVTGRGFCTQPARAVRGNGAVLVSRFDFTGKVEYAD